MSQILDSGERREFSSGAVRDIQEGKGRCDLLPLSVVCSMLEKQEHSNILYHISRYMSTGCTSELYSSMYLFSQLKGWTIPTLLLEVSKHYEEGALKYGEYNWQKGIPLHCYIDSAVRHFLKYVDGRDDEPHDRAFIWNILGALWTQEHLPDMVDVIFTEQETAVNRAGESDAEDTVSIPVTRLAELLDTFVPLSQK